MSDMVPDLQQLRDRLRAVPKGKLRDVQRRTSVHYQTLRRIRDANDKGVNPRLNTIVDIWSALDAIEQDAA